MPDAAVRVHPVRRLVRDLAAGSVVLAGLALAFAWAHPIDPLVAPATTAALELLAVRVDALRFLIGCVMALCCVTLFLIKCPRFAAGALVLAVWGIFPTLWVLRAERGPAEGAPVLRVQSVNLAVAGAETARVLAAVREADPDIVFFQEYTPARRQAFLEPLGGLYPTRHERPRIDAFGMAIYSRVPLGNVTSFHLGDSRTPQFRMELALGEEAIVLYGIHLVPISGPLYKKHRQEFVDLLAFLAGETRPTALVGDFNLVDHGALSGALHERGFLEAHALAGEGRGATWPVQLMHAGIPGIRIDHVYAGLGLTCTAAWVGEPTGSDHLPVGAVIARARR